MSDQADVLAKKLSVARTALQQEAKEKDQLRAALATAKVAHGQLVREVERLRREGQYQSDEADRLGFKLAKAEAEVKRLRTEVNEWRRQLNENIALRREVERLRAALAGLLDLVDQYLNGGPLVSEDLRVQRARDVFIQPTDTSEEA